MQSSKTFFLFSDELESTFVYNEVIQLSQRFAKVIVVGLKTTQQQLPANVEFVVLSQNDFNPKAIFKQHFALVFKLLLKEFLLRSWNFSYLKNYREVVYYLLHSIYYSEKISHLIDERKIDKKEIVCLSFWFNTWAVALGILKQQHKINSFYARTHGIDLFEFRIEKTQRIPFRKFQLQMVDKVFSVSRNGENYLKKKYPSYAHKIFTNYLGTDDKGKAEFSNDTIFTIISCARVRDIKRIFLIPEILKHLNYPIKWIHLGQEDFYLNDPTYKIYLKNKEDLKNYPHIQTQFPGYLSNQQIFDFYKNTSINLFVSVSETEGLPVSIMEAISFGIPVLATDVGGCREIATEQTGILIPKDFDVKQVAAQITEFKESEKNTIEFRNQVRNFWKNNFEANMNYDFFCKQINER